VKLKCSGGGLELIGVLRVFSSATLRFQKMAGNKFWGGSSSSSSSDSDESADDQPVAVAAQAPRKAARWADESSSDESVGQKRVVRSHTDKRYEQLREHIKHSKNHMKIDDFANLITDYEAILKVPDKMKVVMEQEGGPPPEFLKAISSIELYTERLHAEHLEKKATKGEKLPQNKQLAFNTLRAKVRKGNKQYLEQITRLREHPSDFESEGEEENDEQSDAEDSDSDDEKADSSASDGSDSDSDSDSSSSSSDSSSSNSSSGSDSSSGSSSSSDSSSSDSDSSSASGRSWRKSEGDDDSEEDLDEEAAREKKMLRWLITADKQARAEKKVADVQAAGARSTKKPTKTPKAKPGRGVDSRSDDKKKGQEPEEYSPEELTKKVTEIAQQRGRRGFDRKTYVDKLTELMAHASKQGPRPCLYIYSSMVSADFDNTGSAFQAMRLDLWNEALDKVNKMLPLLIESQKAAGASDGDHVSDAGTDSEDPTTHGRLQDLFVAFVEKLDDELYKALQFTVDVYGAEYQDILGNSSKFLILLKRVMHFFEEIQHVNHLSVMALRLMEQVYYKPDSLNAAVYEAIQHQVSAEEKEDWVWPKDSSAFMAKLCRYVHAGNVQRLQRRASLCQVYHLALHDQFRTARDLLHLSNLQEQAQDSDVHTQILYNRVLAQMGLCAFRLGKIQDAHSCLMDVCMYNKARELLAQGLSYNKTMERSPEQDRAERLRQLPYHMHVNLEVLESAHHICAMLLEVPNIAMQSIDPSNKKIISRVLRRALEQYDKMLFTGPPENAKEAVVSAAKALQRGDWSNAWAALDDLKIWDHIDPGNPEAGARVKAMIQEKIKSEALRTYLFAYASIYDAFQLDQLVAMFALESKTVHSIVSKMMIKEEITAFWDESSRYVLVQHVEPTPLQRLALTLADKGAQAVQNNEGLVDQKSGGYGLNKEQRPQQQGRWDQGGGGMDRRRFGKGGGSGPMGDEKGRKGKGRGKGVSGPPRNRGWENARAGALRGNTQRGWSTRPS